MSTRQKKQTESAQSQERSGGHSDVQRPGATGILSAVQVAETSEPLERTAVQADQPTEHQRHQPGGHHGTLQRRRRERGDRDDSGQREFQHRRCQTTHAPNLSAHRYDRHADHP
jgi:hypothetical protein